MSGDSLTQVHCPDCMDQLEQADDGTYPCETCDERWSTDRRNGDLYFIDMFGYEVKA